MASVSRSDLSYLERLIKVSEAATELVAESYCWVTDSSKACGMCLRCELGDAVRELQEERES